MSKRIVFLCFLISFSVSMFASSQTGLSEWRKLASGNHYSSKQINKLVKNSDGKQNILNYSSGFNFDVYTSKDFANLNTSVSEENMSKIVVLYKNGKNITDSVCVDIKNSPEYSGKDNFFVNGFYLVFFGYDKEGNQLMVDNFSASDKNYFTINNVDSLQLPEIKTGCLYVNPVNSDDKKLFYISKDNSLGYIDISSQKNVYLCNLPDGYDFYSLTKGEWQVKGGSFVEESDSPRICVFKLARTNFMNRIVVFTQSNYDVENTYFIASENLENSGFPKTNTAENGYWYSIDGDSISVMQSKYDYELISLMGL